jgi:hypothetical protein
MRASRTDASEAALIHYVCREDGITPIRRLSRDLGADGGLLRPLTWERLFYLCRAPVGHYILTDFDRLSSYEIEIACAFVRRLREVSPHSRVLNDPHAVLERYPLLKRLRALGLNRFDVTRIDGEERPGQYPVFVRLEDDCRGPDTGLVGDRAELDDELARLRAAGKPLKRRIAVGFCAERDRDGYYRKYGAFNLGGRIVPQHILRSADWNVKRSGLASDAAFAAEELDYVRSNPHAEALLERFRVAGIDFGRIDYGLVGGEVQTYEINTNPTFPAFRVRGDDRSGRRELVRAQLLEALRAIDAPATGPGGFKFALPRPCLQRPRRPQGSRWPGLLFALLRGS